MLERIKAALTAQNIPTYLIRQSDVHTAELFFIKKQLDMRRGKDITTFEVTVYHDTEQDGTRGRGASTVHLSPSATAEEIGEALRDAWFAAGLAVNPYYELADKVTADPVIPDTALSALSASAAADVMAGALFAADTQTDAFINSAEVFITRTCCRIVGSQGTDVTYETCRTEGEFVVQCTDGADVEIFNEFSYDDLAPDALTAKVTEALATVRARAKAQPVLPGGEYDVLLSGEELAEFLTYYRDRANASSVYAHYSNYAVGDAVQGDAVQGELLDLTLCASEPYSYDGIPMIDRPLIRDGRLEMLHGATRFCRYLGLEPVGNYRKMRLQAGTVPLAEMQKKPHLQVVSFSDFQMDALSGHFGGEIRLAYWFDGETTRVVTGGSINGLLTQVQGELVFSTEQYADSRYEGPLAVKLPRVAVAGI